MYVHSSQHYDTKAPRNNRKDIFNIVSIIKSADKDCSDLSDRIFCVCIGVKVI